MIIFIIANNSILKGQGVLQSHVTSTARTLNVLTGGDGSIASTASASRSASSPERNKPLVERSAGNDSDDSEDKGDRDSS